MRAKVQTAWQPRSLVDLLDTELAQELEGLPRHLWERALGMPARDFLNRPGKQFRSRLACTSWTLAGGRADAMPAELAHLLELLHAGSLIVDDIEDAAETRRGAPALHQTHGMPMALNVGNWMYFWALGLIHRLPLAGEARSDLLRESCLAVERCHRGQALDLALKASQLPRGEVARVVRATTRLKTSALMELAAMVGAIALGAPLVQIEALRSFGRHLGQGLQMLDDLGGLTSPARAHKGAEDLLLDRVTWPWAWLASCCTAAQYDEYAEHLARVVAGEAAPGPLATEVGSRVEALGREQVFTSLDLSLAELQSVFSDAAAIDVVRAEIARLEKSYD